MFTLIIQFIVFFYALYRSFLHFARGQEKLSIKCLLFFYNLILTLWVFSIFLFCGLGTLLGIYLGLTDGGGVGTKNPNTLFSEHGVLTLAVVLFFASAYYTFPLVYHKALQIYQKTQTTAALFYPLWNIGAMTLVFVLIYIANTFFQIKAPMYLLNTE
jgi:hypothetical protein